MQRSWNLILPSDDLWLYHCTKDLEHDYSFLKLIIAWNVDPTVLFVPLSHVSYCNNCHMKKDFQQGETMLCGKLTTVGNMQTNGNYEKTRQWDCHDVTWSIWLYEFERNWPFWRNLCHQRKFLNNDNIKMKLSVSNHESNKKYHCI